MQSTPTSSSQSILPGIIGISAILMIVAAGLIVSFSKHQAIEAQLLKTSVLEPIETENNRSEADIWIKEGNWLKAREALLDVLKITPTDTHALQQLAQAELRLGMSTEAIEHIHELQDKGLNDTTTQILEVEWMALQKKPNAELRSKLDPIASTPEGEYYLAILNLIETPETWTAELAKTENQKGGSKQTSWQNLFNATSTFEEEKGGQSQYRDALLMKMLLENQDPAWAIRLGERILKSEPNYRDVWIMLGYAQLQNRDFKSAEDALKSALDIDPMHAEARYLLGVSLLFQKNWVDAGRAFELSILHGYQPSGDAYRKLAEAETQAGNHESALETYEYLFSLKEDEPLETYVNPIWLALGPLKDPSRARTLAEAAVQKYPDSAESHALLAWVLLSEGKLVESANEVNAAFRKDRQLPDCYFVAGMLEESRENKEAARGHYEKVLRLSEESSLLYQLAHERLNSLTSNNP